MIKKNKTKYIKDLIKTNKNPYLKKLITDKFIKNLIETDIKNENKDLNLIDNFQKIIQPAIDNQESIIPFITREAKDYRNFKELIVKFLYMHYDQDVIKDKAEKETFNLIKSFLFILDADLISKSFLEIDITTHRNLNDWKFPAELNSLKRNELTNLIKETISQIEPNVFNRIKNYNSQNSENSEDENSYIPKGIRNYLII